MTTVYDFYTDKRKNNKKDNFIDIILDYPIEIKDYEYLKVKLVDFKFLNNIYNISANLMNNQFNIRSYSKIYTYTTTVIPEYTDDGFYSPGGSNAFDTSGYVIATDDIVANKSTLSTIEKNHSYIYYSDLITTVLTHPNYYWKNIFADNTTPNSRRMLLEKDLKYIEIVDTSNRAITYFNLSFMKPTTIAEDTIVSFKIQRFNNTTSLYEDAGILNLTMTQNELYYYDYQVYLTTPQASSKYRIVCDTITSFETYITELRGFRETYAFDNGTLSNSPIETTLTIPDGFYKASTFISTLNTLLTNFNLTTSINQYTNKLKIINNNDFTPTTSSLNDLNAVLDLVIPNIENIKENWGINETYQQYINIPLNSYYEGDTNINLLNLSKIIISTDLNFSQYTKKDLIIGNNLNSGIGNILTWVDADNIPLSCIKYTNYENTLYKIENKYISKIRLMFYNEKQQPLFIDNGLLHLQIHKYFKKSYK